MDDYYASSRSGGGSSGPENQGGSESLTACNESSNDTSTTTASVTLPSDQILKHWSELDPKKMKMEELRTQLKLRKLSDSGLKSQLISRINKAIKAEQVGIYEVQYELLLIKISPEIGWGGALWRRGVADQKSV